MAQVKFQNVAPLAELHIPTPYKPERNGFDPSAAPVWQMVPVTGSRFMQITALGAQIAAVESNPPNIASVGPESGAKARKDVYQIDGSQEGKTFIIARDAKGKELGRLEVWVMRQRTMAVQFFLVSDSAGNTTTTKEADVRSWVDDANTKVFNRQMNLRFDIKAVRPAAFTQDLGKPIVFDFDWTMPGVPRVKPGARRWHTITDKGDPKPNVFNVFCVWDFKFEGAGAPDDAGFVQSKQSITAAQMAKSGANYNMCFVKDLDPDSASIPYLVFAHEAGHYLEGFPFHYADTDPPLLLMRGDGNIGPLLLKRDVDKMTRRW